jgi:hypothetical protein
VQSHSVTPSIFFHRVSATCPTILFFLDNWRCLSPTLDTPGIWTVLTHHCRTRYSHSCRVLETALFCTVWRQSPATLGVPLPRIMFFFRPRVLQVFKGHAGLSFDLPRSVIPNGHLDNALSVLGSCWRFLGSHQEGGYDHVLDWSMTIDWFGGQSREAKQLHSSICLKLVYLNFNVKKIQPVDFGAYLMLDNPKSTYVLSNGLWPPLLSGYCWWYAHTQPMLKLLIILGYRRNGRMADEIQKKTKP